MTLEMRQSYEIYINIYYLLQATSLAHRHHIQCCMSVCVSSVALDAHNYSVLLLHYG